VEPSDGKPAETASIPAEPRPHSPAPREREKEPREREKEKNAIRTIPLTVQPAASVVAPAAVPAASVPTVEAAVTPEDRRDANDLARAAIERLRGGNGGSPHASEAPRIGSAPQAPSVQALSTPVSVPAIRPLPPPIMVSTPPADSYGPAAGPSPEQTYSNAARSDDPRRPTPPADIPPARPVDLSAGPGGAEQPSAQEHIQEHTNVAEDMLLAAKSMFHAVLPQ
jgi:hypothetical protein